jgi:hypothetical protein
MQKHIDINEYTLSEDKPAELIQATKITFFNRGNIPVYIGEIPVVPGANYQVNYEHPHIITYKFKIRFDTTAAPVDAGYRTQFALENLPRLVIQTMTPKL